MVARLANRLQRRLLAKQTRAWEFDLDDEYDRAAMYKIVLEEGQEADQRRLLNWRLLRGYRLHATGYHQ